MPRIRITRSVELPDPIRLARCRRAPELGPRVLFFSGGTALKPLSQELVSATHNSTHIITPFDSGGSSAIIRKAFSMLAVGDLRNRLMALADRSLKGNPEIFELFATRLPKEASPEELNEILRLMIRGKHELVACIPDPMRKLVRSHLGFFANKMGEDFDLRGASVGNLILAGGYFNYNRHIDPVIYLFSKLVEVRGTVRPVISKDLHLVAEMEDGSTVIGQHLLTGKEAPPISSPIAKLSLSKYPDRVEPVEPAIRDKVAKLIRKAELICYPMGSFYTSLIANLLPKGVGTAVASTPCPKVYVPSSGVDPEQKGMSLFSSVRTLLDYLQQGCNKETPREDLLNFILIDSKKGVYPQPLDLAKIKRYGVEVIDADLVTDASAPLLDENKVIDYLLSLT
ncbi:MAG: GAK system CofD-like protein [Desulfovibrio sp.]|nr:MAG: GAK system CofD-like protein [Desulfovibrio sp.]